MSKFLTTLLAAVFAAVTVTTVAFAQEKTAPKKANPVTAACKGKKAGDEVTVDGKKVKCPAPKKAAKKSEPKKEMKKGEGTKAESMK
jgi:hypothetical protein